MKIRIRAFSQRVLLSFLSATPVYVLHPKFTDNYYICVPEKGICMANHQSAKKRIRQIAKRNEQNHYYKKSTRTSIRKLREMTDKVEALSFLPKVISMIDRLVKRNSWHKNKAAHLKSQLMRHVASL